MSVWQLELADWRRAVASLYGEVRALRASDPASAHRRWRAGRDALFAGHPQSPLPGPAGAAFDGLEVAPYDPAYAFTAHVEPATTVERYEIRTSGGTAMTFERFGTLRLPLGRLDLFWLDSYGGGLFLPFRDTTNGRGSYGGGRYLLDTAKGADLGTAPDGALVVDFNFAYHPSCHYDDRWSCPLAPPSNRLEVPVEAGEQVYARPG